MMSKDLKFHLLALFKMLKSRKKYSYEKKKQKFLQFENGPTLDCGEGLPKPCPIIIYITEVYDTYYAFNL